ncbi:MAG: radical SAM protein [Candidatus Omnitrophica bacterium]|nr:radical SAM protein [Candidatus Omnitrophota bacterium]
MGKNILLINPAINSSSQNKIVNAVINTTFPTSLGALAGFLGARGIGPVRIIDEQLDFIKDRGLPGIILSLEKPRIVGLSVLTINSKRAYELGEKIKGVDPECLVVAGGIHPTVLPEEALSSPGIDMVVRGEGEKTFEELSRLVMSGDDPKNIPGISFKGKNGFVHNPDRPVIENLDDIPPFPYHLFEKDKDRYPSFGGIFTSRGCPYNCIFCSSRSISGKRYRYFSVGRVVSEIKALVEKYGQKTIWLMDDNIAGHSRRFMEILDSIIAAGFPGDVSFHGSMRADNISEAILDKAKAANFRMIAFGMETGSESLMSLIGKGETVKQVVDAVRMTNDKGIAAATTIIFGLPGETARDRRDAIKLANDMPLASTRFNTLTPYPGTPVYEMLKSRGEVVIKKDWENFAVQYMWEGDDLPYVPKGNDRYGLMFDTMYANLSFYLSVKGIKRILKSSFAGGNVIKMSGKWYLSPAKMWNMARLVFFLNMRFFYVALKVAIGRVRKGSSPGYDAVKDDLDKLSGYYDLRGEASGSGPVDSLYNLYAGKIFENVIYEKYADLKRPLYTSVPFNYQKIPAPVRYYGQKLFRRGSPPSSSFPLWPYEGSLERLRRASSKSLPEDCLRYTGRVSWPGDKKCALILTHDIENGNNWKWVKAIAEAEMEYGFRSSWNVVPRLYRIDYSVLDWLARNGFEIGLHGYNHDNKLAFLSEAHIRRRMDACKDIIGAYKMAGFRSPSWLRSGCLFRVLQDYFSYDCSVLDVDYISPAGVGGCCSVFPYMIGSLVELPTTLPYEFPVQCGVKPEDLNAFWKSKISRIKDDMGCVTVVTHPDPYYGGNDLMVRMYKELLKGLAADREMISMLPRDAAKHYAAQRV